MTSQSSLRSVEAVTGGASEEAIMKEIKERENKALDRLSKEDHIKEIKEKMASFPVHVVPYSVRMILTKLFVVNR